MKNLSKLLRHLILFVLFNNVVLPTSALPALRQTRDATNNITSTNNDFTSDFAKQIIRISKAADIKAYMNTRIDPCNDFYKFSCGNWHRINPAQLLSNIMTDTFQTVVKAFDRKLKKVLTSARSTGSNVIENEVKNFYEACLAVKHRKDNYKKELQSVLQDFGAMPALSGATWNESEFTWWRSIAQIHHRYGKEIILGVTIMGNLENNTKNGVYLGVPDDDDQANTKIFNLLQLVKTSNDMQSLLDLPSDEARRVAKEMVEFERELVQGGSNSRLDLSLKDLVSNLSVAELQQQAGDVLNVQEYLDIVLGAKAPEHIFLFDDKYWKNLLEVMSDKPKRIVANYIMWQLLQEFVVQFDSTDSSEWCMDQTKKYFGKFTDNLVYSKYRTDAMERDVYELWAEIRQTFREQLQGDKLDWIQNSTREYAIEKLDAMQLHINSYANENFTQIYEGLKLNKYSYIENMQAVLAQRTAQIWPKLNGSAVNLLDDTEVLSFTPAYNILDNTIKLPVALLQPLYIWDQNYPQAIKYATIGYLIAHELIHGFDDDGRKHDKMGNYHEWWDPKSTYEFESRRKCFQAQYHNYKYGGNRLPESISQAENIADNAGIKLAYAAYMKWWQRQSDNVLLAKETLPDLNYNNKQLFFIAFAQVWCDDVQFLFKSSLVEGDSHAPSMYRVIGALSNFQEFSWVFQCKPDAPMDPEFKCSIY